MPGPASPCCWAPQQSQTFLSLSPGANVQVVQGFQLHQPQKEVLVRVGETLTLSCTVTAGGPLGPWLKGWGSGNVTIYDQKDPSTRGKAVGWSNTDFTILIRDVRPEDAGTYYCVKFRKGPTGNNELYQRGEGTYSSQQEPALPGQSPSCPLGSALGQGLRSRPRERVPGPGGHSPPGHCCWGQGGPWAPCTAQDRDG
uniref:Ig-like domain-containing protein n=1 Tax=Anas zonorhyncha TaxID=75864 RepID=A0A8B9UWY0_9AVES